MLAASTLIQAATNMFNEYFDYVSGLDTAESVGIAGVITQNGVPPKTILRVAVVAPCFWPRCIEPVHSSKHQMCSSRSWRVV
jgi:hypothetical protein